MTDQYVVRYFGRQGSPITHEQYQALRADADKHVAWDELTISGELVEVSTAWTGLDPMVIEGRPLIFETMIFGGEWNQMWWRWYTEREAAESHEIIVRKLKAGESLEDFD